MKFEEPTEYGDCIIRAYEPKVCPECGVELRAPLAMEWSDEAMKSVGLIDVVYSTSCDGCGWSGNICPDALHRVPKPMTNWKGWKKYIKTSPVVAKQMPVPFVIKTPEGKMQGKKGDYVCVGEAGDVWPARKEIFKSTYSEVVEDGKEKV